MREISYSPTHVQGFHGCDEEVKQKILSGKQVFKASDNKYDWLGKGIYFWESDPYRAQAWAKKSFGSKGAVIGAKIRLGICFDLSNTY